METAVVETTPVSLQNGEAGSGKQSLDVMEMLQKQRESLKLNLQEMDKDIKKLSGRGEFGENRRSSLRRVPLKRDSLGASPADPPNKRRWGSTAFAPKRNLALEEAKVEEEKNKPTLQSSVVVTAKVADEAPAEPRKEDITMKKRNKRMFGLLLGTLKQFKQDSQMKTETESKQEEKMIQVEEKVQREKEEIIERKKDLIETRQGKRLELEELEFKIAMTELNQELKSHYEHFTDFIQLKSTPCIFYKPAIHNDKTVELLAESQATFRDSFEQRQKEISLCTEEDIQMARIPWDANSKRRTPGHDSESKRLFRYSERGGRVRSEARRRKDSNSGGKSVANPIIVDGAKTSEKRPIIVDGAKTSEKRPIIVDGAETSEKRPIVVDGAKPSDRGPIVVDGDAPPRPKGPITVYDDDNDYGENDGENDVTIVDDKSVEEEDSSSVKKFKSVVIGGDHSEHVEPVNDSIEDNEELPYTDWGQFVEDEEQVCNQPELIDENHNAEDETNEQEMSEQYDCSPPGDDDYKHEKSVSRLHEEEPEKGDKQQGAETEDPTGETFTTLQEREHSKHTKADDLNNTGVEFEPSKDGNVINNELESMDEELKETFNEQNCVEGNEHSNDDRLKDGETDVETEDSEQAELELPLEDIPIPPVDPSGVSNDSNKSCEKDSCNENITNGESHPEDDDAASRNIFTDIIPPPVLGTNENSADDFEYAEQLLEEVVDKKMGIVSPSNSYNVIDERVFSKETFGSDVTEPTPAEISLFAKNYSWHEG